MSKIKKMSEGLLWWNYGILVILSKKEILYTFRSHETGELDWRGVFADIDAHFLERLYEDNYTLTQTSAPEQIAFLKTQNVELPKPFLLLVKAYSNQ
jgi:hypothetical protein